jgi:two-component system sensor histidine kinase BarA
VLDRLGIRSRVLLLALLPASLMALVLGSYFTWLQQNDLHPAAAARQMIAEQLAPLAAPAMARQHRAAGAHRRPIAGAADVRAVPSSPRPHAPGPRRPEHAQPAAQRRHRHPTAAAQRQ